MAILDFAVHTCAGLNSTELPECLSTNIIGSSSSIRGVDEVWIRSFAVHIAALASFGHLMSLQGNVSSLSAMLALWCHLEYPEIVLAQTATRVMTVAVRLFWRRERLPLRFVVAVCLGVHALPTSESGRSISLTSLRPDQVKHTPRKFSVLWFGRFGLLLAFLAQYTGSAALWIKLVFHLRDRSYWYYHIDMRTFEMVAGGLVATINSALVLLISGEWKLKDVPGKAIAPSCAHIPTIPPTAASNKEKETTVAEGRYTEDLKAWTKFRHAFTSHNTQVQEFNHSFKHFLDSCFPSSLQSNLEVSVLLQRIFVHSMTIYLFRYRRCPPILQFLSEASSTFEWTQICADRANIWDPTTFTSHPRSRLHSQHIEALRVSYILFNIGMARVFAHWLFIMVNYLCEKVGKPLPRTIRSFEHWVLSGRSILSFPLLLLLFACGPLWIISMLEQRGWVSQAQAVLQQKDVGHIDQLAMNVLMWKDPWQDSLYLI